ncbi:hypothetical protein H5410_022912 [Solanum commersonii]|uniref:Uncharacterized protein n=1 Tax=Solanum commersonii TaxID=4109 RepID=A0A9J5ZI27_SOLCO|nr:hypothetical protein H5410_022912 [Solanum commersonii]
MDLMGCSSLEKFLEILERMKALPLSIIQHQARLKELDLSYMIFLVALKELYLCGKNFEHLPQGITQHGALRSLNLSHRKRLKELPGFMGMQYLDTSNLTYSNLIDGGLLE